MSNIHYLKYGIVNIIITIVLVFQLLPFCIYNENIIYIMYFFCYFEK